MFETLRRYFADTPALLKQVLLGGVDVAQYGLIWYKNLILSSIRPSVVVLAVGVGLVVVGELAQKIWIGALGVAIFGLLAFYWLLLATPVIAVIDAPTRPREGLTRVARLMFSTVVVTGFLVAVLLQLPESFDLSTVIVLTVTVSLGVLALGLSMSRPRLVAMLLVFGSVALFATVMPQSAQVIMKELLKTDVVIADLVHEEQELRMDISTLQGAGSNVVKIYERSGESLWWCREASESESGFRCFSREGIDPVTRATRFPLTEETVTRALENLRSAEMRAKQEMQVVRAAEERAMIEGRESERLEARNRMVNVPPFPLPVLVAVEEGGRFSPMVTGLVEAALGVRANNVLLPSAYEAGLVSRMLSGDPQVVRDLDLHLAARTLILGSLTQRFVPHDTLPSAGRVEIQMDMVAIDATSAQTVWRERIDVSELGHNQSVASELAQQALSTRVQTALRPVLQARRSEAP